MDIQRHLDNEPVVARPPSQLYRFGKMVRRNKVAFTAVNAVALAIAIGFGVSTRLYLKERAARAETLVQKQRADEQRALAEKAKTEAEQQRDAATKAQVEAEANTKAARKVSEFLQNVLGGIRPNNAAGRDTTLLRELLDRTAGRIDQEFKGQPALEAELRHTLSIAYKELGEPETALPLARKAVEIRKALSEQPTPGLYFAMENLRSVLGMLGKESEIEVLGVEHANVARKVFGDNSREVGSALQGLGWSKFRLGEFEAARDLFRQSLATDSQMHGALHGMAFALQSLGDLTGAEDYARRALARRTELYGRENTFVSESLNSLGSILRQRGDSAGAEEAWREALAIRKKLLSASHPQTVASEKLLKELLAARAKNPSPVPPSTNPAPKQP